MVPIASLKLHPQAHLVPPMRPDEWRDFYQDVAFRGVKVPLEVLADGTILDGRHRYQAAVELGMAEVLVVDAILGSDDATTYMLKAAVLRRHLTDDQRAMIAHLWKQENKEHRPGPGRGHISEKTTDTRIAAVSHPTEAKAAEAFKVSPNAIKKATYVANHAPELAQQVHAGEIPLNKALREIKRGERPNMPALPEGVFDVILADPPWEYRNSGGLPGQAGNHYHSVSLTELCSERFRPPSADDAVLFLWVTNPMLPDALTLVNAWGFEYKTDVVWIKRNLVKPGVGFYVRGRHELLFICVKGSMLPEQSGQAPIGSVIEADIQDHSRKPKEAYELIESLYPQGHYLEMFARGHRNRWTTWGSDNS